VMLRSDSLLLPWLTSYQYLGIYVVAASLSEFIVIPVNSIVDAHIPKWSTAFRTGQLPTRRILLIGVGYTVVAAGSIAGMGHLLLVPLFGSNYAASVDLLLPLSIASGLWALSRIAVGLLLAMGRPRQVLLGDISAMVLSIAGYCVLIPWLGVYGAALGCLAGYGLSAIVTVAFSLRNAEAANTEKSSRRPPGATRTHKATIP
jgi:O-antigen/teichoic acid export membrane protein